MRAALYREFRQPLVVETVPDPQPANDGVVLEVMATGVCRSDWHGWMGHDADITLPQVPGHELAGVVVAAGKDVRKFRLGDRVTVPFVCACGSCAQCDRGDQQVCDHQEQPGFTHWGSFAQYVALRYADENLVRLPDDFSFVHAASLGCRFATAYRAVVAQGRVGQGDWLAVHGVGGVGLAAVAVAAALGARVIAVDPSPAALRLAALLGAEHCLKVDDSCADHIRELSDGGVRASIDADGDASVFSRSIRCLGKRGRHVQVGLMTGSSRSPSVPADRIIAEELEIVGSHGLQAHAYPEMLSLVAEQSIDLDAMLAPTLTLDEAADLLANEELVLPPGVSVIDRFSA